MRQINRNLVSRAAIVATALITLSPAVIAKDFFDVVSTAVVSNPDVLRARANANAQNFGINAVRGEYLPSLDLNAGFGKERTVYHGTNGSRSDRTLTRSESSLVAQQLVFDGWGVNARYCEQTARFNSALYSADETEENVAQDAVGTYLDAVKTREIARLAKANEREHVTTLNKVRELYKGGAGRKGDISLARGRLAQTRASLKRLQNDIKDANAQYLAVVGEPLTYKVRWPEMPKSHLPKSLDEALHLALQNSPVIKGSDQDVLAAEHAITDAKSAFYPKFYVELSASENKNLDGSEIRSGDRLAMLKAQWNLLRGGSDRARYNQASMQRVESSEIMNQTRRQVTEDVTRAWNQYVTAKARLQQLRVHMLTAREVLDAYQEQYKLGQRQLFNLLDQANELFDSKVQYVNGRDEMIRQAHNLLRSMGLLVDYVHNNNSVFAQNDDDMMGM